ncbi:hypothetical protein Fmac_015120 [Flemingia macrophylla]|uniref:DNA helicase n=1 Tax=Flemingia macrophylla TaxID=520843 RepID=A0ABD1MDR9_9FABA
MTSWNSCPLDKPCVIFLSMKNIFRTMFWVRSLRLFRSTRIYSSRHHLCKTRYFSKDNDRGSWESIEGLLHCSANSVPLSPVSFLERAAKVCRDRTSLVYGSLEYNWDQTHQRCLKLASALTLLGISRGDVVRFAHKADEQTDRRLAKHIVSLHFEDPEVITATPRQIESLIRLSEALARICYSEKVEKCDVMEEFRLLEVAMQQSATDHATGSFSKHCYEMTF